MGRASVYAPEYYTVQTSYTRLRNLDLNILGLNHDIPICVEEV